MTMRWLHKYRLLIIFGMTFVVGSLLLAALKPQGGGEPVFGRVTTCVYVPERAKSFRYESQCTALLIDGTERTFTHSGKVLSGARVKFMCRKTWFNGVRHCGLQSVG